jgi:hypothetical protein
LEIRPLPTEVPRSKLRESVRGDDRSRSRSAGKSKISKTSKRESGKVREPAPIEPQRKLNLANYVPLP